jgi:hypothetical protein
MVPNGFDRMMLRRIRRSRVIRAFLCVAGLVSLTAAFGLHPEPSGASATPGPLELSATASVEAPAHECIACLTASSVLVSALSTHVPVSADSTIAEVFGEVLPAALPVCSRPPGRAPPSPRSA